MLGKFQCECADDYFKISLVFLKEFEMCSNPYCVLAAVGCCAAFFVCLSCESALVVDLMASFHSKPDALIRVLDFAKVFCAVRKAFVAP